MQSVKQIIENNIGILEVDYPPVNALSQNVRQGIVDGIDAFTKQENVEAIIIRCAKRTFIAGADIKEFGKPPTEPFLPDVVNTIEACPKPVVASMFGTSLGGGLEVALACHYRVAQSGAKFGLPEVNLGLIPGAGGTQRLPRLVGIEKSIEIITSGKHQRVDDFSESALFDAVFDLSASLESSQSSDKSQTLNQATIDFVSQKLKANDLPVKRTGEIEVTSDSIDWDGLLDKVKAKARGKDAPVVALNVISQSVHLPIEQGMAIERAAFLSLRESEQSAALRYAFSAEKQAAKIDIAAEPADVKLVGVIGAGNMGSGIATALLNAGYTVCLVEKNEAGLQAGIERITSNFAKNIATGRMSETKQQDCLQRLKTSTELDSVREADLVLEAIFEDIQVKKELFSALDKDCKNSCIFATNTSYLDIDEIAQSIADPSRMVGMHFFSPAHIMKLLEVVKAKQTSQVAVATAMQLGKAMGKISVLVGVCFGFAGNRMYTRYGREVQQMLLEGASIAQIDKALESFGMAMGPLKVQDLSGIDIGHSARSAQPFPTHDPGYFRAAAVMVENNRLGRKTGAGFYQYPQGKPVEDPASAELIATKASELGINQQRISDEEIIERALFALISEGLALLAEGIVSKLSDIDVIWLHGYGFPRHKGGPMFQAIQMGKETVEKKLKGLREKHGQDIWPEVSLSPLS